ncbi:MAG: cytochrome c [Pseudomonadota bacterium]|nr:cytochrome c [Pseudomonadota bacterium]
MIKKDSYCKKILWIWLASIAIPFPLNATETAIDRGRYLANAAGCLTCHTDSERNGIPFAGGREIDTPFGVFIVPNITPDEMTGIGKWNDSDFIAAVLEGRSPSGEYYYPSFPYPSYAGMQEQDVLDIKSYLDSMPASNNKMKGHKLKWYIPGRWAMKIWQSIYSPWEFSPLPAEANALMRRGAYLVRNLGHCSECHTPRNRLGILLTDQELEGGSKQSEFSNAPNITNDKRNGIGEWTAMDLEFFLDLGMLPDGDFTGSDMAAVIDNSTSQLTAEDREAMVVFLRSVSTKPEE